MSVLEKLGIRKAHENLGIKQSPQYKPTIREKLTRIMRDNVDHGKEYVGKIIKEGVNQFGKNIVANMRDQAQPRQIERPRVRPKVIQERPMGFEPFGGSHEFFNISPKKKRSNNPLDI